MTTGLYKKGLVLGIICLFIGAGVLPITGAIKNFEKVDIVMNSTSMFTITVDDEGDGDYTSIQDAIYNANPGDTIKVYSGTYIENVVVDKQLTIMGIGEELGIGDDVDKPSIDSGSGNVVHINADSVNVSGFIIQNGIRGICMEYSNNNIITGNYITDNNYDGILLRDSSGNTIRDNVFQSNGITISGNNIEHWNSHIIENNIANGGQIRYYKNINNVNVPSDTSQVILANCSHFTIQNLNLSHMDSGVVRLGFSSDNTITGNNITDNKRHGIWLYGSSGNTITGNNMDNNDYGIGLQYYSSGNTITGNNIDNSISGISLQYSSGNTITGNNIDNNHHGIRIRDSSDNTIRDNVFQSNGITNGITISGNKIEHWNSHIIENNIANGRQIRYYENTNNVNVPSDTSQVILANCSHFTIQNLNLSHMGTGVQLGFSSDNTITGNNIDNNNDGILLQYSLDNTITGNNIIDNRWDGISLDDSSDNNIITGNNIDNNFFGIHLGYSSDNTITGNNIDNNLVGIELFGSSGNTITGNNITDNNFYGIELYDSNFNTIKKNNFIDNKNQAYYENSHFNFWFHNYWNNWSGTNPRPIYGTIYLERFDKEIEWLQFDWRPAKEPFDIN
ncbi:nitrous oxide reductase family maturation protein NosD [Thermoplasmatota archaeon]